MIVVDSDVAAELMRPAPAGAVLEWLAERSAGELYTTTIALAEILAGIEALPRSRRKELVRATAVDVFAAFEDHVLDFDTKAGAHYAALVSARDRLGQPISAFDAQVAAICRRHQATLATGKSKSFRHTGVEVVDPWGAAPAGATGAVSGK